MPVTVTVFALPTFLSAYTADVLPLVYVRASPLTISLDEPTTTAEVVPS